MTVNKAFNMHRRRALAGLGALLSLPLWPRRVAGAVTPPFRRKVGAIELTLLSDGSLNMPLSFMLPETPPVEAAGLLTAHGLPASGSPMPLNVTLVKTGNEYVLIDAGSGSNYQETAGQLAENLEAANIDPASIGKVVFTHGHPDHLWGAIDDFDNSERFPNASYVIAATEWDFWINPDTAGKVPDWRKGMAIGSARVLKRLEGKIERRKPGDVVAPGLSYMGTPGHTPGHVSIMVESGGERLFVAGDALTHPAISFARPDWRVVSDHDHDAAAATRRRLLDQLATDRLPLIGFHLPWPGHGIVERDGTAYRFVPV
jgi:glyoxylase-like metal-dependent hydrolase (beta-lactamase superfamily II)